MKIQTMPDNVSRWPLALREAWQRGYDGLPENRDGRVAIESYACAYHDGQRDRALVEAREELRRAESRVEKLAHLETPAARHLTEEALDEIEDLEFEIDEMDRLAFERAHAWGTR